MKVSRLLIILTIVMIVSIIGATIVAIATGYRQDFDKYREVIDFHEKESLNGIQEVKIKTSTADIDIIPTDDEEIAISFTGERYSLFNKRQKTNLKVEIEGETLNIVTETTRQRHFLVFNWSNDLKLTIHLPKTYHHNLDIKISTGDVKLRNLTLNKFVYNGSTGNLDIRNLSVVKGDINSSTGDVEGTILSGDLDISLSTGEIDLIYLGQKFNIDINVSTGDVKLYLQPDATFDVDIKTSTGSIDNEFNLDGISERKMVKGYVKESGVNSLKIRTSTGDVELLKN